MSKWFTLHIKNELLLWFFIVSIVPLILMYILYFFNLKSDFEENTKKYLTQFLNEKVEITTNYITTLQSEVETLALLPQTKKSIVEYKKLFEQNKLNKIYAVNSLFEQMQKKYSYYDMFLIDIDGNILYSVKQESDLYENIISGPLSESSLAWAFKKSKFLLRTEISTFAFYSPSKAKASFLSTPIFEDNKVIGFVAIQISDEKLFDMIINYDGLGESGELVAGYFDKNENILAAIPLRFNKDAFNNNFILQSKNLLEKNIPVAKAIRGNSGMGISVDYRNVKILASWKYIPILRWGMVVKIDYDEVMQPLYNRLLVNLIILFFVIFFIVFAIILVTKHIVDPVQLLITKVNNISNGKLDQEIVHETKLENEIGILARSFNIMSKSLHDSQEIVKSYATKLESKVENRTHELEISKQNLEEVNQKISKQLDIIDQYVILSSTDLRGIITDVSEAFCVISGYSRAELIGKKHSILKHPDFDGSIYKDLWKNIIKGNSWFGEIKNQRKDGSYYWVDVVITPQFDKNGKIEGYSSIRQDITDKKRVEELAITDQLTKIYNRLHLENSFKSEIDRARRYNITFSLILLDIDHFKLVNDTFGHDIGDDVLVDVVNILKNHIRATDILGRWGGEEFLLILPQTDIQKATQLGEHLREQIAEYPFKIVGHKTCSFGVAEFKLQDIDSKEIVKRADNALYIAKKSGRNRVVVSDE